MKRPSFQFYPADWRKDAALQSCSLATQGLWANAMCIAHECVPYGHLTINGHPMTVAQIARLVSVPPKECEKLLAELSSAGVTSVSDAGAIYSRRMVRDEELRNIRAAGGIAGAEHGAKGAEHGIKGGRPKAVRGVLKPPIEPPPSSSSSSSASTNTPISPQGGKRSAAVSLTAWLDDLKARGEKPIPEADLVFTYANEVGIPSEFLRLAWLEFRHRYSQPDTKHYLNWRSVFRNAVRANWLKLWYLDGASNTYALTTVGHQAQRAHDDRKTA